MGVLLLLLTSIAHAQTPRISALYPAGARVGETVEVSVKGGSLAGARRVLVTGGAGVSATLVGGAANVDEGARPLFQSKCTTCHEARSPANRSLSPEQWAATVERMITARGAEIAAPDKTRIVGYLQALSKAGQVAIKVQVAPNAAPGIREVRVLTGQGVSTAQAFEVGTLPEVTLTAGNNKPETAQKVTLPVVVNGVLTQSGEKQFFTFDAKKNQRLTLSLKAFRLNEQCAAYFNPVLFLYDSAGHEIAKNLGRFGVDPVIDWTAPADGTYTLLVHDLIWKGSPSSVYRLVLGTQPDDGILSPVSAAPGARLSARLMPVVETENSDTSSSDAFAVSVPSDAQGMTMVATPGGESPLLVRDLPDGGAANTAAVASLPAVFRGLIAQAGQTDTFHVRVHHGGSGLEVYARRLGSPLHPQVTVTNDKGRIVASRAAVGDDDLRIANAFPSPGEYTVAVTDADGAGGKAFAYCWESLDGTPDFQLTVSPDSVNLAPGSSTVLTVRATRRENLSTPIRLRLLGLSAGVAASGDAVLLPGMETAVVVLSAAPNATVGVGAIIVEGQAAAGEGTAIVTRRARPLETYRVNNVVHLTPRGSAVVAVTSEAGPPFTLAVAGGLDPTGAILLAPGGEVKLTVRVGRQAEFKGEVQLVVMELPPGVNGPTTVSVKGTQNEATVTLRASGDAACLKTKPSVPVRFVIAGYVSGGGFGSYDGAPAAATAPMAFVSK